MTTDVLEQFRQRLAAFLIHQTHEDVIITHAQPLAGGASRDMWLIEAEIGGVREKLALRRDLPTVMNEQSLTRAQEFAVLERAYANGVKVARPRYLCDDPSVLGGAFFLMDYVEGIAIGRKVVQMPELAHARSVLPAQMGEQLARIHAIRADEFPFLPRPPAGKSPALDALDQIRDVLDKLGVHNPAFEFALRWAADRAPQPSGITFIHGDFRIGNISVVKNGLQSVFDWEFAHVGDPDEELGYPCMRDWRFGVGQLRFGGIADRETFLRAYEAESGRSVDRAAVDFWEFLGNLRWGVICLAQAARHLSGRDPSVELASLGRRSAEMQYEMLKMIERMGV
jgi:aminoglycoside phosphotransferase (APT) family kinase protein